MRSTSATVSALKKHLAKVFNLNPRAITKGHKCSQTDTQQKTVALAYACMQFHTAMQS